MSFLDIDVSDAQELQSVPEGDYKLRFVGYDVSEEKYYVRTTLQIVGPAEKVPANAKDVTHFLYFPKPDDDAKRTNNKKLGIKRFLTAFGIASAADLETGIGNEAWAFLKEVEPDEGYEEQGRTNRVRSFSNKA